MKNLSPIIIATLFLLITVYPVIADLPVISVDLSEIDSFEVYGDSVDANDLYNHWYEWHMGMTVSTPDVVTGPHIEFTSNDLAFRINLQKTASEKEPLDSLADFYKIIDVGRGKPCFLTV